MNKILADLNEQQLRAVEICDRPLRIIAGAGSGKTKVITTKIAYLIKKEKIPAHKILAMTFTNKAAKEMKERVRKLLDDPQLNPFISTFHAFCARVLREDYQTVGLEKNFSIIDTNDQRVIVRKIIRDLNFDQQKTPISKFERQALGKISGWKNELLSPKEVLKDSHDVEEKKIAQIYQLYQQSLKHQNFVDFDDLQVFVFKIFDREKDLLAKWQKRFTYVMVDEFQDTNELQFDLIKFLTRESGNLTVVGDPDQTIYSWRGAKTQIILRFNEIYENAVSVILNQNYRSTQQILDLANDFIDHNKVREKKVIFTQNPSGVKAQVKECTSRYAEAKYVTQEIERLVKNEKYQYGDFFILYRMNAWSQEFEKTLSNAKIPFQLIGGIKFRERKVIKDALAFLKVLVTNDDLSTERLLKLTPKIGSVTVEKLQKLAEENKISLYQVITSDEDLALNATKYLSSLKETLNRAEKMYLKNEKVETIAQFLLTNSGYWENMQTIDDEEKSNENNLKALLDQLHHFDEDFLPDNYGEKNRLLAFLQEEALTSLEDDDQQINRVSLLTIHSAKGLENKVVFVVGLNRDVFPSRRSMLSIAQLEEERRTLYVAMTRAEEKLYLTFVSGEYSHLANGLLTESRFIRELNNDLYDYESNIFVHRDGKITSIPDQDARQSFGGHGINSVIKKGDLVNHILLGDGIVIKKFETQFQIAFNNPKFGVRLIDINSPVLRKK